MAAFILAEDGSFPLLTFDLTLSEMHEGTSLVTTHAVETGGNIADHIIAEPATVSLVQYVTNTPLREDIYRPKGGKVESVELEFPQWTPPVEPTPGSAFRLAGAALGAIGDAIFGAPAAPRANLLLFPTLFDRVVEAHAQLEAMRLAGVLVTAITSSKVYNNMAIARASVSKSEAGGAEFQVDLTSVRLVSTATVAAPQPAEPRGAPGQNMGAQATKGVTGKEAVNSKSIAIKLAESMGVL